MVVFFIVLATVVSTTLGGLFAVRFKDKLHLILGFSAGAVLGVALFDLLPESIDLATKVYSTSFVTLLIAAGFSSYMILDRVFSLHAHGEEECENPSHHHKSGGLGASALTFHSFLDGVGIGLAFKVSPAIGWVVAAAVLTHDFSDGINTVNMVIKNDGRRKEALGWLAADALAPAIGLASTFFLHISASSLGLVLAVFVGLFLYISASDLIPESHHRHPTIWTTVTTILGMAVIFFAIHLAG
jgi:ZIP family zinc transporter